MRLSGSNHFGNRVYIGDTGATKNQAQACARSTTCLCLFIYYPTLHTHRDGVGHLIGLLRPCWNNRVSWFDARPG